MHKTLNIKLKPLKPLEPLEVENERRLPWCGLLTPFRVHAYAGEADNIPNHFSVSNGSTVLTVPRSTAFSVDNTGFMAYMKKAGRCSSGGQSMRLISAVSGVQIPAPPFSTHSLKGHGST